MWGIGLVTVVAVCFVAIVTADRSVFGPSGLNSTWSSYSFGGTYKFMDTSLKLSGFEYDILAETTAGSYGGGLSIFTTIPFANDYSVLEFQIAGNNPTIQLQFAQFSNQTATRQIFEVSNYITNPIESGTYTKVSVILLSMPLNSYDLITWVDENANGITFKIGEINFYTSITTFSGAEAIGSRTVVVYGGGNCSTVTVSQNNNTVAIASRQVITASFVPSEYPRCYLTLATTLVPGSLTVTTTSGGPYTRTLSASVTASLGTSSFATISDNIYGMAQISDPSYLTEFGVTVSRWGGNEATPYNPSLQLSNQAADNFFYGEEYGSADDYIGSVQSVGASALLSVPALDWVADKDDTCYSFPVSVYGPQTTSNGDAGGGTWTNGTLIQADPSRCYTPWTTTLAKTWLEGLTNKPVFAVVDNEMDIANMTHQDIHFNAMTYNEILNTRYIPFAQAIKQALPNAILLGPSSCCWYYYWNSVAGDTDKAAHNNTDFLQWFLSQMNAKQATTGRLMDYLDVHYYPDANVFSDAVDSATRAVRLRATRSLWDPTYTDEGDIGTNPYPNYDQPNPNNLMLIPRMKQLLQENYPGTLFAITEYNFGAEADISSGLAIADILGIFGAYGLDLATYWTAPAALSAAASAWFLYRDNRSGRQFGSHAVWFNLTTPNPDLIGTWAAYDSNELLTIVLVNKNPSSDYVFHVGNLPTGSYVARHFSNTVYPFLRFNTTLTIDNSSTIVVPAYSALFLAQIGTTQPTTNQPTTTQPTAPSATGKSFAVNLMPNHALLLVMIIAAVLW